jgi:hypothetical protein
VILKLRFVSDCPEIANIFDAKDACTFGLEKCKTSPLSLNILTSSIPCILFTVNFFNELCNFFSSVTAVL